MKRALAVSDDPDFHAFLAQACAALGLLQLISARSGAEAMSQLRMGPVSVAVLDFNAASWDSYQLLNEINQRHPGIAVLGLTQTPEMASERRMKHAGAVRMLNRRVPPETLMEELEAMANASAKGHIEGIHLASLLQVLDWERKNCLVGVYSEGRSGLLHFQRGLLVHAECPGLSGEEAGIEILGWDDASIDFLPSRESPRTVHRPLKELLMLAAQLRDEAERDEDRPFDGLRGLGDPVLSPDPS